MRDNNRPGDPIDEALSALHDGELSPEQQAELIARAEQEPEVAARLAVFSQLDEALRALPEREVPADLGLRLRRRLEENADFPAAQVAPAIRFRSRLPSRGRWVTGAGLAAAAALALYWSVSGFLPQANAPFSAAPLEAESTVVLSERPDVTEEEVGIALHYDTLANLEVIEQLEMLELLVAMENAGDRG